MAALAAVVLAGEGVGMAEWLHADLGPGRRPRREPDGVGWALLAVAAGLAAAVAVGQLGRRRRLLSR